MLSVKREVAGLRQHRFEHGPGFDAREGGSDAVMDAMAERQVMARRTALQIDEVGLVVLVRIPVPCGEEQQHRGSGDNIDTAECGVARDAAHHLSKW